MTLTVPESFRDLLGGDSRAEEEARKRLAAHYYSIGEVSLGTAASLAGVSTHEFASWLRELGVAIPWDVGDLEIEVAHAKRLAALANR